MRREQVKGRIQETEGRVMRGVGKATGNRKLQAKGALREAEGKVRTAVGRGKEKLDRAAEDARARNSGRAVRDGTGRVVRDGTVRVTTTKTTVRRKSR